MVRVEPLFYNKPQVPRRALKKIERVLYFDNPSTSPGFKVYLRAKLVIPINNPLVPGFFFDYHSGEPDWVTFRYEKMLVYCNKCGRVGHTRLKCRMLMEVPQKHVRIVMENQGVVKFPHILHTFHLVPKQTYWS